MSSHRVRVVIAIACGVGALALTPKARRAPRGFNSWDSSANGDMGEVNETQVYAIAAYMAENLLPYGWDTLVVDEGWAWMGSNVSMDAYGRPTPREDLYPSAAGGAGWTKIAAAVHAVGLRFGVWTMRGIPQYAVKQNLPIAGSTYTAAQAQGPTSCDCEWDAVHNFATNAPAQAAIDYYTSVAAWYAQQGIDYVKIDCMWRTNPSLPEHTAEVVAFATAFESYNISVSFSPGGYVSPTNGSFIASNGLATAYRVTQDLWDIWNDPNGPDAWPTGLRSKLDKALQFASLFGVNGSWPDLDMLPLGRVMHWENGQIVGPPSATRFTPDEQRLLMTLWCSTGAPLMFGGILPLAANESDTLALLTNSNMLALHGDATGRAPVTPVGGGAGSLLYAWAATLNTAPVVSVFNARDTAATVNVTLADAGMAPDTPYCAQDMWTDATMPTPVTAWFAYALAPHAAASFRFTPASGGGGGCS